jgi:hypothetical protein
LPICQIEGVIATKARVTGISAFCIGGFTGSPAILIAIFHLVTTFVYTGKRWCPSKPRREPHPDLGYGRWVKQKH